MTEPTINKRGNTRIVTNAGFPINRQSAYGWSIGTSHEGDRDYYAVLGYKREPDVSDFMARYLYQDIATRIVDLPAQDTWKRRPVLIDGDDRSDEENPRSKFIQGWQQLTDIGTDEAINLYAYCERIDRLAGIGRFGVLLIGCKDGQELDIPVSKKFTGPQDLLYLSAFSEESASINPSDIITDPQDRRFGKPGQYQIKLSDTGGTRPVHWTRVIHVAEDLREDEVYGKPRLESIMNRLDDLVKVVGGSAEATWKLMRKGLLLVAKDGYQMPASGPEKEDLEDQLFRYEHDLARIIRLGGVEATDLGSEVVDPSGLVDTIIGLIAASTGIPQRILLGSERGQLASEQDERNWASSIANRQTNFAEPVILRPLINWCLKYGILPKPVSGRYRVEWQNLFELNETEEAQRALNVSQAITGYIRETGVVNIVTPDEFRERVLKYPPSETPIEIEEPEETEEDRAAFEDIQRRLQQIENGNGDEATTIPE